MNASKLHFRAAIILLVLSALPLFATGLTKEPMVGLVQDNQVTILLRGSATGNKYVHIEFFKAQPDTQMHSTETKRLSGSHDFTESFVLDSLEYNTNYIYRAVFNDGSKSEWYDFTTFPEQGKSGRFNFVFSADIEETNLPHTVFDDILAIEPDFVALLGDQVIADHADDINNGSPESILPAFRGKYLRNFDGHLQVLGSHVPIIATWDDHDYGLNNSDSSYAYKDIAKQVFKENYPAYPYEDEEGGIYYKFKIADVDVFVLDVRWYRSEMSAVNYAGKTMLGDEQLNWLLNGLKESTAPFKFIFSGTSFNDYGGDQSDDKSGYDSWMGYKPERNAIMDCIKDNHIRGVMAFSGDQHFPSAHILNWQPPLNPVSETDESIVYSLADQEYAFFDFSASPLNIHRATGHDLSSSNQGNPAYSYEIFRPAWAFYENIDRIVTNVYGLAEVNTKDSVKTVTVSFYERNQETGIMEKLYEVTVENDQQTGFAEEPVSVPSSIQLKQNYPNPFNGVTEIAYSLASNGHIDLSIFDIRGSKVRTLVNGFEKKGNHKIRWNGKNTLGMDVPSGVYFYRIKGNAYEKYSSTNVKKMVYIK